MAMEQPFSFDLNSCLNFRYSKLVHLPNLVACNVFFNQHLAYCSSCYHYHYFVELDLPHLIEVDLTSDVNYQYLASFDCVSI